MKEDTIQMLANFKAAIGQFRIRVEAAEKEDAKRQRELKGRIKQMKDHINTMEESFEATINLLTKDSVEGGYYNTGDEE